MITNRSLHYQDIETIRDFQEARLKETLKYVAGHSPFYQKLFSEHDIDISSINTIEDLQQIPPTTKQDLQLHNTDFLCVNTLDVIDYVTTSGTLGEPVTFALTEGDLQRLAYNEASSFALSGCTRKDVMQLMTTIDRRFMAGLAYFMGARELGCGIVRVGNGIPELQWDTIRRVKSTVCMVVPSFLMKMIEFAEKNGIDYNASTLKRAICIGEALRTPEGELTTLGKRIQEKWSTLELYSTYASTEMQTSFTECEIHQGGHIPADLIIVEMLDENNQPVVTSESALTLVPDDLIHEGHQLYYITFIVEVTPYGQSVTESGKQDGSVIVGDSFNAVFSVVANYDTLDEAQKKEYSEILQNGFYVHGRAGIFDEIDYFNEDRSKNDQIMPTV